MQTNPGKAIALRLKANSEIGHAYLARRPGRRTASDNIVPLTYMLNKKYLASVLTVASLITSMPASANYTCSGPVKGVSINGLGAVVAESIGKVQWGFLCNVETATNGINPATCKTIYATLLTAQTSGRSVTLWVTDPATVCPDLPARWSYVTGFNLLRMDG